MSDTPYIHASYWIDFSPKELFQFFLSNGWMVGYNDNVSFVKAKEDVGDWQSMSKEKFSLEEFVNSHDEHDPIRIDLKLDTFSGSFLINRDRLSILIMDTVYIDDDSPIPDFSWYLQQLAFFFAYAGVRWYECGVS